MGSASATTLGDLAPALPASPATCVPLSTCPLAGHRQGSRLAEARCPQETSLAGPWARMAGRWLAPPGPALPSWAWLRPTLVWTTAPCLQPHGLSSSHTPPHRYQPTCLQGPWKWGRHPPLKAPRVQGWGSLYLRGLHAAGAGGHRRSESNVHSTSHTTPQEWGPPVKQMV